MILVAESGSTKTQWCLITPNHIKNLVNTPGINPFTLTNNEIKTIMRPISGCIEPNQLQKIYFFGAGCSTSANKEKIKNALANTLFCTNIEVDTDLKAACISLAGNKEGLIGLLGTGSNSCIWDGEKIIDNIPSLGYILGDDGGGVSIGKQLVADYLLKKMPQQLLEIFDNKYSITRDIVVERIYQRPMANRYLASFAPFAKENIDNEYCQQLIHYEFNNFIERNIMLYPNYKRHNLYFCGSTAYVHQNILKEICRKHNLQIKDIVKEPITNLANYYLQNLPTV